MNIKIGTLPGRIETLAFEATTVKDAIEAAGLSVEGRDVKVNGRSVTDLNTELHDGDTVILARQVKGNVVTARVGSLPGVLAEVALEDGSTVSDALEQAGKSADGYEIRMNGSRASLSDTVPNGATVLLTRQVKGNY